MGPSHVVSIFALTYWTILVVELIGDKSIYTMTSLAARFRPASVSAGVSMAFMAKMLVAVLLGQALLQLPARITAVVTALTLFSTAVILWKRRPEPPGFEPSSRPWTNGFGTSFAAIFFSEWADVGQISAAALAVKYRMPAAVWMGATAALMTKGLLALTLGMQLRRHLPSSVSRLAAVASCAILAIIALGGAFVR